jgi:HD-GYP domain-containing protein (c-di-GMP phosphodiesterase class II)
MRTKVTKLLDTPAIKVDLHQAVCALAEALSLVGIDEHQHGERVAYMAVECATRLHWEQEELDDLFHAGLLHDCGVSSSRIHRRLISEMDWDGAELHCVLGEYYLSNFPPLAHLAPTIRYHHTHWENLKSLDLPQQTKLASNLIFLVDRVDALRARLLAQENMSLPQMMTEIRHTIAAYHDSHFAPQLIEVFLDAASNDAFWLSLEPLNLIERLQQIWNPSQIVLTDYDDVRKLSRIFAHIVDAKSDFTFDHSLGVAQLSRHLSQLAELPEHRGAMIEIAALLHDLGKLGVPDEILEKPGPLDTEETLIMHRHSYETYRILRHINGFEQIAEWAGNHHETLLGDGYPFQHEHTELTIEARIIAVADIFQALAQKRPYRRALSADEILQNLKQLASEGRIDNELVKLVTGNLNTCYRAATEYHQDWIPSLVH